MKKCKYADVLCNDCRICESTMELSNEATEKLVEVIEEINKKMKES